MMPRGRREEEAPSQYSVLERHFLNTFFSGLYISTKEIVAIGEQFNIHLDFKNREVLFKSLFAKASESNQITEVIYALSTVINNRIQTLQGLMVNYPNGAMVISELVQKAKSTDLLIKRELRKDPYGA